MDQKDAAAHRPEALCDECCFLVVRQGGEILGAGGRAIGEGRAGGQASAYKLI